MKEIEELSEQATNEFIDLILIEEAASRRERAVSGGMPPSSYLEWRIAVLESQPPPKPYSDDSLP